MRAIKTTPQPDREKEIKMLKECDLERITRFLVDTDPNCFTDPYPSIFKISLRHRKRTQKKSKAK